MPGPCRTVPEAHRDLRQDRAGDQCDRGGESRCAGTGRRHGSPGAATSGPRFQVRFCIPTIVKDNFETIGLQTTVGSLSLEGFVPSRDAFQVKRIKEAGAIVLAKSNMAEFAFTPYKTVSSILPGYTRNPYALDRVTAGSSGGTAAAVAANFGGDWSGKRHGELHPGTGITSGAGRHPLDDGADEPKRRRPAEPAGRHRGAVDADARRRCRRAPGHRGSRSGQSGDGIRHADRA